MRPWMAAILGLLGLLILFGLDRLSTRAPAQPGTLVDGMQTLANGNEIEKFVLRPVD